MGFCSMSGFTVMRLFNDYASPRENDGIFTYCPEGCNRDGLAVRAAGSLMSRAPYEHKMLIVLSDVKPLDAAAKIRRDERDVGVTYDGVRALTDTACEVRRLRAEGIWRFAGPGLTESRSSVSSRARTRISPPPGWCTGGISSGYATLHTSPTRSGN